MSIPHPLQLIQSRRAVLQAALAAAGATALGSRGIAAQESAATPVAATFVMPTAAQEGGRLRVAYEGSGVAENLNKMAFTAIDYFRQFHVLEPLARFVGAGQDLVLAEAITPNADGSIWTIALRDGVHWHDGDPLTATDVLESLRFYGDPAGPGLYLPLVGGIDLANASAIDELTVQLPMLQPANDLHLLIGGGELLIYKAGFDDPTTLMGTGPFTLTSFTPGQSTLLTRNPDYWGYPERGPFVDEIEILSITGASARANAVEAGQADFAPTLAFADGLRFRDSESLTLLTSASPDVQALPFVMYLQAGPFTDIRLRDAVRLSTNRQALVDTAFLGFGVVGNDLYGIGQDDYNAAIPQRPYDPDAARALVEAAGADGLEFEFLVPHDYAGAVEAATVLVEQLNAIGLRPTLATVPIDAYVAQFAAAGDVGAPLRLGVGSGFLLRTTWQFTYSPGAMTNLSGWDNPEWQANFAESQTTPDPDRRRELLDALQLQLWEEGGDLVWGFFQSIAVKTPALENVAAAYYPLLSRAFIAGDA